MKIIDGKKIAQELSDEVAIGVAELKAKKGFVPGLAVILIGEDPASQIYVKRKIKQTKAVGMDSYEYRFGDDISQNELLDLILKLNSDDKIHGILVQLPLPKHIDANKILDAIDPFKDVDGFHPVNVGRYSTGSAEHGLIPCTPLGCMMLLDKVVDDFRGLKAVVIGKSNIVGKPVSLLLLERECTVTITHILTKNIVDIVRSADIVIAAAGSPKLVKKEWVKDGAIVIDVGINRIFDEKGNSKIVGDVDFENMSHVKAITPVPGGVGPMTIACLLSNTLKAANFTN